jgi:hypothetical protein
MFLAWIEITAPCGWTNLKKQSPRAYFGSAQSIEIDGATRLSITFKSFFTISECDDRRFVLHCLVTYKFASNSDPWSVLNVAAGLGRQLLVRQFVDSWSVDEIRIGRTLSLKAAVGIDYWWKIIVPDLPIELRSQFNVEEVVQVGGVPSIFYTASLITPFFSLAPFHSWHFGMFHGTLNYFVSSPFFLSSLVDLRYAFYHLSDTLYLTDLD